MSVTVRFRGGPFAGELRSWPGQPESRLKVPTYPRVSYAGYDPTSISEMRLDYEEYELSSSRGDSDADYVYDWINPAPDLRQALAEQHKVTEQYRQEWLKSVEYLNELKVKADKWDALVESVRDLTDEATTEEHLRAEGLRALADDLRALGVQL